VRGDLLVALTSERTSRLDPGSRLDTDRGALVVERSSPHQDRWIVHFEGIEDRDQAERWRGVLLRGEAVEDTDPDALWVHDLVGASVVLVDGAEVGRVVEVEANPASDLLVLDGGALVPVAFVTDHGPGRVVIDPPEGLFDL
jgi:16S rRNA processing protein RimM